jgi:hypothetical protein
MNDCEQAFMVFARSYFEISSSICFCDAIAINQVQIAWHAWKAAWDLLHVTKLSEDRRMELSFLEMEERWLKSIRNDFTILAIKGDFA